VATLIGVYNADGGALREFMRGLARASGAHACALYHLTHSAKKPRGSWRALRESLAADLGHDLVVVHRNHRSAPQLQASSGREPCVLIDDGSGQISMILDWNDLDLAGGDVAKFERILRSKLLMY
jgi:hypothetical protein